MTWSKEHIVRWKFNLFTFMKILRAHSPVHDGPYAEGYTIGEKFYQYDKVRKWETLKKSWRLGKGQGGISINTKGDGLTIRNDRDGIAKLQNTGYTVKDFTMPDMPNKYGHPFMMAGPPGKFLKSRKGFKVDKHKGFVQDAIREFFFNSPGVKVSWGKSKRAPLATE